MGFEMTAAVDHREAKLFNVLGGDHGDVVINSHTSGQRLHHQPSIGLHAVGLRLANRRATALGSIGLPK
jgi:hypothetical protein